jgi:hypothetical protein
MKYIIQADLKLVMSHPSVGQCPVWLGVYENFVYESAYKTACNGSHNRDPCIAGMNGEYVVAPASWVSRDKIVFENAINTKRELQATYIKM